MPNLGSSCIANNGASQPPRRPEAHSQPVFDRVLDVVEYRLEDEGLDR